MYVFLDARRGARAADEGRARVVPAAGEGVPAEARLRRRTGAILYTTVGAMVPCRDVREGVTGVRYIPLRRTAETNEIVPEALAPKPTEEDVPF